MGNVPLTGFAHGNAGLGLALLELHAVTGRDEFREGGRAAFAHEDHLFDSHQGNLPARAGGLPLGTAWCHGAPGIGLARSRAVALDPGQRQRYAATAHTAIRTTMAALQQKATLPHGDATLCHGLTGLTEIVLTAGQWLGEDAYRVWASRAVRALLEQYGGRGDWPSGVASHGPNPSLMVGSAGIGYHFLRQYDPLRVPALLVVH
jgi:lantibiotic modifying enzyme